MRSFGRKWQCILPETGQSIQEAAEHVAMGSVGSGNAITIPPLLIIPFESLVGNFDNKQLADKRSDCLAVAFDLARIVPASLLY